jgi:hypothetical protein
MVTPKQNRQHGHQHATGDRKAFGHLKVDCHFATLQQLAWSCNLESLPLHKHDGRVGKAKGASRHAACFEQTVWPSL